jgi:hypothetical protein
MQKVPELHDSIDEKQLNSLLVIARQSAAPTQALKDYLLWADSTYTNQILIMTSSEAKARIEGQLINIKKLYQFLFGSLEKLSNNTLNQEGKGTQRHSESTGMRK